MKRSTIFQLLLPFIIMAIPWAYLAYAWNDMPAIVPTHYNISGEPNAMGSKNEIILIGAFFSLLAIGIYFLLHNIHKIDPKRKYSEPNTIMSKLALLMLILLCGVFLFIIYWAIHGKVEGLNILYCGMSLFFAYIGNLMHSIKPNYFAGFRLPWTLENEDNWRKTHQLASKIWFIGGVLLAIISLLVSSYALEFIFLSVILIMAIVPSVYSYNLYRISRKSTIK